MDHGASGLKNTLEVCSRAGIETVGAGDRPATARRLLIRRIGRLRVAVMAVAEHEFSISANGSWGANPLDLTNFVRTLKKEKSNFDYLIVLFHGSHEFLIPTPRTKDTCHFMIEQGANAVIVQHPHCVGGYESYLHGHIVYGQGAFLMDEGIYRDLNIFHDGILVKLHIGDDFTSRMEVIPYTQSAPAPGARRMTGEKENAFRNRLAELSASVQNDEWVQEQWLNFCEQKKHGYLSGVLGYNRVLRKLNKTGLLTRLLYGKQQFLTVRNMVCCETHREALHTIFTRLM
jgi:poly-gamma-glutamate synthesis protein (capsule biosynthesis protein)